MDTLPNGTIPKCPADLFQPNAVRLGYSTDASHYLVPALKTSNSLAWECASTRDIGVDFRM